MKKGWMILLCIAFLLATPKATQADPVIVAAVKALAKKVIRAIDLAVQRLQNRTIALQNAQKVLENALSKLKLKEIGEWVDKQREQYAQYFEELNKVKTLIAYYHRVKEIMAQQVRMVEEYKRAYTLFKNDKHFTAQEILYMAQVYEGMLNASLQHIDQLVLVVNAFKTQMTDHKRMAIINQAANAVEENYQDLQAFNNQNKLLSLQRSKSADEAKMVKAMYGLP